MAALPEDYKGDEGDEKKKGDDEPLMADGDMDKIMAEIEKQPLVSEKKPLDVLLKEFKDHDNFTRQMNALISENNHSNYRQMRRDGNCFYRAFLLGLFETIEANRDIQLLTRVSENVMTSLHRCLKFGFESFTIEDFYYAFMDELQFYQRKLESGNDEYKAQDRMGNTAIERMANSSHANYLIFWARMLASLHLRENEKEFEHFIPQDKGGFTNYLRSDVEALKAEADHLQTVALSRSVDVPITIYCLENIQKGGPQKVNTIESKKSSYDILFRPGHYDVLYRNSDYNDKIEDNDNNNTESKEQEANKEQTDNTKAKEDNNNTDVTMKDDNNNNNKETTDSSNNNNNNGNDTMNTLPNNGNTKSD